MKKMKYFISLLILSFTTISFYSCHDDVEKYPTFDPPNWYVDQTQYSVNMTAVVALPNNLTPYLQTNDMLAAFDDNGVCRGEGSLINGLFYVTIKGTPDDQAKIKFKYYCTRNKYMYITTHYLPFDSDAIYGTVDNPSVLALEIVK